MVYTRLFMVANLIEYNTEIDMCQELSSYVCNFFVFLVILDCVSIILWVLSAKFHVVDADAIVRKCFTVYITNSSTNLKELLILFNCRFVLPKVII